METLTIVMLFTVFTASMGAVTVRRLEDIAGRLAALEALAQQRSYAGMTLSQEEWDAAWDNLGVKES